MNYSCKKIVVNIFMNMQKGNKKDNLYLINICRKDAYL